MPPHEPSFCLCTGTFISLFLIYYEQPQASLWLFCKVLLTVRCAFLSLAMSQWGLQFFSLSLIKRWTKGWSVCNHHLLLAHAVSVNVRLVFDKCAQMLTWRLEELKLPLPLLTYYIPTMTIGILIQITLHFHCVPACAKPLNQPHTPGFVGLAFFMTLCLIWVAWSKDV